MGFLEQAWPTVRTALGEPIPAGDTLSEHLQIAPALLASAAGLSLPDR
jgi:hypothetical protein